MDYPLSVPGVGLVGGKFSDGNPLLGQQASLDPAAWANQVTDELLNVLVAAGIAPSEAASNQLLLALRAAGVFTTPAQFDVSTKAATMGALQRALGNFSSSTSKAGNYALTVVDAGSEIVAASAASPLTYTMPALSTVANGTCFTVVNLSGQKITLAPTGADRFIGAYDRSGTAASYVIENGDTFTVTKYQGALWLVSSVGGTMFASLATNGYQNLPSGLKECRGTFTASATPGAAVSVTFAQAFTTLQELVITPVNASTTTSSAWHDGATASGFNGRCNIASAVCHYVAKGTV